MDAEKMKLLMDFALAIAPSKFLPQYMRNDAPTIFHALATGDELGLAWTHAARSMFPGSDGGIGMKGDIILALLLQHGFDVVFTPSGEGQPVSCSCTITRPAGGTSQGKSETRSFSIADAETIEYRWLPDKERWAMLSEHPWYRSFPREMCQWRSLAMCARVIAADLIGGIYLPEELMPHDGGPQDNGSESAAPAAEKFVVGEKEEVAEDTGPAPGSPVDHLHAEHADAAAKPLPTPSNEATSPSNEAVSPSEAVPTPSTDSVATPPPDFKGLIESITSTVGGEPKMVHKVIARFMAGYLGLPHPRNLPKDEAKLLPSVVALANALPARKDDFVVDPEGLGNELAGRKPSVLQAEMDMLHWPPELQNQARLVMASLDHTEERFVEWIHFPMVDQMSIAHLAPEALAVFFPLFLLVKGRAWEVVDFAVSRGYSPTEVLQGMAKNNPVGEWDEAFALQLLEALTKIDANDAPAAPAAPDEDDWANGGLPFSH